MLTFGNLLIVQTYCIHHVITTCKKHAGYDQKLLFKFGLPWIA